MSYLRRNAVAFAAAATITAMFAANRADAAPYASGISETGGQISYILNEAATNVTIVRDGIATSYGALGAGAHSFSRDGASSYYIQVEKMAASGWSLISTDTALNNFELPRGVGVNTNPSLGGAPNPYFGRVYVTNGRSSATGAGRAMSDGIYMLNADLSAPAGGTGPHTAGVGWSVNPPDTGGTSPFRVQVGPDNGVYVTDWSDTHSGLWRATPDLSSAVEVLDSTGRSAAGLNATHGSVSDVIITGTGSNRVIYTSDEDYLPTGGTTGSVLRYDIGNGTTFSGPPSAVTYGDGLTTSSKIINFENSIALDKNGNLWLSQNRSNGTDQPSLLKIDPDTGNVLWESLAQLGSPDPLRGIEGIAVDPVSGLLALVTTGQASPRNGLIMIFDPETNTLVTSFQFGGGANNTDVVFDAAGNLYVGNRSAERLRIWSPGGDTVWTSGSDGSFFADVAPIPEPGGLAVLAAGGLLALRRRRA